MKKIFRLVVLFALIVVSFYLIMTVFVVFAVLATIGAIVWLFLRYFGKTAKVTEHSQGITIDQVPSSDLAQTAKKDDPVTKPLPPL